MALCASVNVFLLLRWSLPVVLVTGDKFVFSLVSVNQLLASDGRVISYICTVHLYICTVLFVVFGICRWGVGDDGNACKKRSVIDWEGIGVLGDGSPLHKIIKRILAEFERHGRPLDLHRCFKYV